MTDPSIISILAARMMAAEAKISTRETLAKVYDIEEARRARADR
jgi:hypothetical protein